MNNFEIHDLTTNELLSDNLSFDEIPELVGAYIDFYPTHNIIACNRMQDKIIMQTQKHSAELFKTEWYNLIEENLCNIY